jgi:hypothetical protein
MLTPCFSLLIFLTSFKIKILVILIFGMELVYNITKLEYDKSYTRFFFQFCDVAEVAIIHRMI